VCSCTTRAIRRPRDEVVKTIADNGGTAASFAADELQVGELFDTAEQLYGGVDVVVHTAGIMLLAPLTEFSLEDLDRMHRINIRGTFVVNQQAARRLRSGGALINFSSSVVKLAFEGYTGYAATKGAVDAMTRSLPGSFAGGTSP
jgi:3-oxoacyl-[acyl-carrier protein] reductase